MKRSSVFLCVFIGLSYCHAADAKSDQVEHWLSVAGDIGVGGMGGVPYATFQTGLDVREGELALGLFSRLRMAMKSSEDGGGLRPQDWDEVSDYIHILRYLSYRRKFDNVTLKVRAGELLGYTMGHGTLLRDYSNVADLDHLHSGLLIDVMHSQFSFTAMLDNLIKPAVISSRLAFTPFPKVSKFSVGVSFAMDPRAPVLVLRSSDGLQLVDHGFNLETNNEVFGLMGMDVEYRVGDAEKGQIAPYVDFNTSFHGIGLHAGALCELPITKNIKFSTQLEYNVSTAGYAPSYVQTFYDLERYQVSFSQENFKHPKLNGILQGLYGGHGILAQMGFVGGRWVKAKIGYAFHPGPDAHQLWFRVSTTPIVRLNLGSLIVLRGIGEGDQLAGFSAIGEARYRIFKNLYALAQYSRTWLLQEKSHYYDVMQGFNFGIGGNWSD